MYYREREITDTLVGLLISTVHRINARVEVKVTKELIKEFRRVTGKENLLFRVAEATVDAGDRLVRDTRVPVASQQVLRDLVAEFKSSGPTYQRTVKATLKASYTNHYRAGLIKLLDVLEFRSNNTTHHPVLDALELVARHASTGNLRYYRSTNTSRRTADSVPTGTHSCTRPIPAVDGGWCAWSTRYAPSRYCGTSCAVRRSGSPARTSGATLPRICQQTSRADGSSTTRRSASPWTPRHSSTSWVNRYAPNSMLSTRRCRAATGCKSATGRAGRSS